MGDKPEYYIDQLNSGKPLILELSSTFMYILIMYPCIFFSLCDLLPFSSANAYIGIQLKKEINPV